MVSPGGCDGLMSRGRTGARPLVWLAIVVLLSATRAGAAILNATTAAEFNAHGTAAQPGDEIVVADGFHPDWGLLTVTAGGTATQPVVIRSQTPGGATLAGDVNLKILADWVVLRDMRFEGAPQPYPLNYTVWLQNAEHVRITNMSFHDRGNLTNGGRWLGNVLLQSGVHHLEIDGNVFDGYLTNAFYMYVRPDVSPDFGTDIHIHDNQFLNGKIEEAISLGSGNSGNDGSQETRVVIENNLFQNHVSQAGNGTEMLQIKTSGNTIRGNTFIDCQGHISNRSGANNVYDANVIINQSHGIRIFDAGNQITNNVFVGTDHGISLGYSNVNYKQVTGTLIAHNTFLDTTQFAIRTVNETLPGAVPPEQTTIANNVFVAPGAQMLEADLGINNTVDTNLFHAADGQPVEGIVGVAPLFADPLLTSLDENGIFPAGSPAIDAGSSLVVVASASDGTARPQQCGPDIGHLERPGSPCAEVPALGSLGGAGLLAMLFVGAAAVRHK